MDEIEVRENPAQHRFEIWVGDTLAGLSAYRGGGALYEFPHTEISPSFEGRGLASTLIRTILETVRDRDAQLLPTCPFIKAYIQKHPEYADVVPEAERPRFGLS